MPASCIRSLVLNKGLVAHASLQRCLGARTVRSPPAATAARAKRLTLQSPRGWPWSLEEPDLACALRQTKERACGLTERGRCRSPSLSTGDPYKAKPKTRSSLALRRCSITSAVTDLLTRSHTHGLLWQLQLLPIPPHRNRPSVAQAFALESPPSGLDDVNSVIRGRTLAGAHRNLASAAKRRSAEGRDGGIFHHAAARSKACNRSNTDGHLNSPTK